jgi:hypothetical protein
MRNPAYFDNDLGIYKDFHFTTARYVEIRASATNWINHPLRQFGLAGNSDQQLNFQLQTPATCAGCVNIDPKTGISTPILVTSESPTNINTVTTGTPLWKTGSRFVTLAAKFYF